jgi:hypothetical protein
VGRKIRQNLKAPAAAWKPRAEVLTGSYIMRRYQKLARAALERVAETASL